MIYTDLDTATRYQGIHKNLDKVLNSLTMQYLLELPPGKTELAGDNVFINRMDYETIHEQDGFYEAHIQYIDVHILLQGTEQIFVSQTTSLTEVKRVEEEDFIELEGNAELMCRMKPGSVLIAFPEDAHMVKIMDQCAGHVEKAVVKVRLR